MFYILKDKKPIAVDRLEYLMSHQGVIHVAESYIGNIRISTVFLGIDHNSGLFGPPALFETMVFGGKLNEEMERYSTWEEAEKGHAEMVEKVLSFGVNK